MTDTIVVALPDGRWLALDRAALAAALAAGAEMSPHPVPSALTSGPRLLTSDQLGDQLNIPATWLEEAARRCEVPSVRIGKYVRFDPDEVMLSLNPRLASARAGCKPPKLRKQEADLRIVNVPKSPAVSIK